MNQAKTIRPQEGYQMAVLSSPADIVISGGAAGAGKTFTLLLEMLRNKDVPNFGAVIFRRTYPMIKAEGGLWDASHKLYSSVAGAKPTESFMEWDFGASKLKFAHLQHEKNKFDWQGSEIPLIGFDELTHFSKATFFYMLTRNRSTCGVRPYVRATCNPDPDSWVAEFIEWWIDQETGCPIPERQGVVRYFMTDNDQYIWGDTADEVVDLGWHALERLVEGSGIDPKNFVKSVTFIGGSIFENKELLAVNPEYLGSLNSQPAEVRAQLLDGNWKIKITDKDIYDFHAFADVFTNEYVPHGKKYITADIAMKGSDRFVAFAWSGKRMIDFVIYDKSDGQEVVEAIKTMAKKHNVPNSNIVFDNDGLGAFINGRTATTGFIPNSKEFNNGGAPYPNPENPLKDRKGKILPENYANLKTQCYYRSGDAVARGEYYIPPEIANRKIDGKRTLKEAMIAERKAIKKGDRDNDGKWTLIPKSEMKVLNGGKSPDLFDGFMQREFFDLKRVGGKYVVANV